MAIIRSGLNLRPQTNGDLPFVCRLYASTRLEELAHTGWPESILRQFLEQQFRLQYHHYATNYPGAELQIVECDGVAIGRLYLYQSQNDLRIVDISLLPEFRGQGYGATLLNNVLEQARATGSKVSIHVETTNPAQSLYARLGFEFVKELDPSEIYRLMECTPN